ncbi:hypothetical protein Gohar_026891, partial [Gossypium harknessii]|nr:hypothetical protein [Gossypium harknessii]
ITSELSTLFGDEILFIISHQLVSLTHFIILLLNVSLNDFGTQTNLLMKPLMILLRRIV